MNYKGSSKQLSILRETVEKIAHEQDEKHRIEIVFDAISQLGFSKGYVLSVFTRLEPDTIELRYAQGEKRVIASPQIKYPRRHGLTSFVLEREVEVLIDDAGLANPESLSSMLAIPLFKHNVVMGVFNISSTRTHAFSEKDVLTLRPFCAILSLALESPKIDAQVQTQKPSFIDVITQLREKQVLILGKDNGPEVSRLHAIGSFLRKAGYDPLLVKDHPDIPELSNEEKVRVFADASRFVILENTFPAGQIAELKMCATNRIITAAMRETNKGSSFMVTDYFNDFDFIREFEYRDLNSLDLALRDAVKWGELKLQERAKYYDNLYPWRKVSSVAT